MAIRDLGRQVSDLFKPDGSVLSKIPATETITKRAAEIVTNLQNPGAILKPDIDVVTDPGMTDPKSMAPVKKAGGPPYENILEQFASYVPLWSMACLTPKQYNDPSSYRGNPAIWLNDRYTDKSGKSVGSSIVFASAGRWDGNRSKTLNGQPEYYVDNFVMNSFVAATQKTGNSNAIGFSFDIYEPYSMGLLLQSMQTAAIDAGWPSYLDNAPYLLKLEFLGYKDNGEILESSSALTRYFTVKLKKVKFSVNEGGSNYKVECIPYNHQGFSNTTNMLFSDISITGNTLNELLVSGKKGLIAELNKRSQVQSKKDGFAHFDLYDVVFPTDASDNVGLTPVTPQNIDKASASPNKIKDSELGASASINTNNGDGPLGRPNNTMGFQPTSGGNFVMKLEGDVISKDGIVQRNKMTINPTLREFKFSQKQTITEILAQCVLSSDYARDAINPEKMENGMINWFRVDVQIQLLEFDIKRNDYAKKIIYRILPYKVHSSIFTNPTSAPPGYQTLKKTIGKSYNYIYTGQNNDLLKFDIDIDNMFYVGKPIAPPNQTATQQNPDQQKAANENPKKTEIQEGTAPEAVAKKTGSVAVKPDKDAGAPAAPGGSGEVTTEQRVAEAFQNAFLKNSADLINLNIDILGDPYFLVDSGIGNYLAPAGPNSQITADGTMNYEGTDVYVYVTFRTPIEPNLGITGTGGLWNFPKGEIVSPFSGIYKVTKCDSKFSGGAFTQTLRLIRMMGQPQDYEGQVAISEQQSLLYKKPEEKPASDNIVDYT